MPPTCNWTYVDDYYAAYWKTECGNEHQFIDGGPVENGHKWCPYCGSMIREVKDGTMGFSKRTT